jgi:ribonuclease HI
MFPTTYSPASQKVIDIWCDGACGTPSQRANIGGWGAVIKTRGRERFRQVCDGEFNTTNQRMELVACVRALEEISLGPGEEYGKKNSVQVNVYSDSAYLVDCINRGIYKRWITNDWLNIRGEPVKHRDLWERLIFFMDRYTITFMKVPSHSGNINHDRADALAQIAVNKYRRINR